MLVKQGFYVEDVIAMKETTPTAMPPCFERWCKKFDDCWKNQPQKIGFRHYVGGLLGEEVY